MPTLNAFDNGDIRATTLVMRMREGKPGGGKGPLLSEDRSLTLATANDQTLFVLGIQNTVIGRADTSGPQGKGHTEEGEPMFTIDTTSPHAVATTAVRRLTPTECERLQGFPDGWTEGQTDTNRYKQMGNAVAVPVVEWLVKGIATNS